MKEKSLLSFKEAYDLLIKEPQNDYMIYREEEGSVANLRVRLVKGKLVLLQFLNDECAHEYTMRQSDIMKNDWVFDNPYKHVRKNNITISQGITLLERNSNFYLIREKTLILRGGGSRIYLDKDTSKLFAVGKERVFYNSNIEDAIATDWMVVEDKTLPTSNITEKVDE